VRVLMLSQLYPPHLGGLEQHVRGLASRLVTRGHEVSIATLWHKGLPEFELDQGVKVHRIRGTVHRAARLLFSHARVYAPPFPDPELTLALRRIVLAEQPLIVHAHNWLVHSFLPLKDWSGAKLVVTLHDYGLVCAKWTLLHHNAICSGPGFRKCLGCASGHYGPLKGASTVLAMKVAGRFERVDVDLFVPVSHAVAAGNGLTTRGLPFQVIPNFLPDVAYDSAGMLQQDINDDLVELPSDDYLLFVGALGPHKGVDVLLDAYASLADHPPLVLVGYEHSSYDIPLAGVPGKVIILKNLPHAAVMEAWRRSTIALIPSLCPECCPTVAMEAMATGRPVIASDVGGLPDIVEDGVTGLLVPPGDLVALREAIERLLAEPGLRSRMGRAGKEKASEFRASTIVSRIERAYSQLME